MACIAPDASNFFHGRFEQIEKGEYSLNINSLE